MFVALWDLGEDKMVKMLRCRWCGKKVHYLWHFDECENCKVKYKKELDEMYKEDCKLNWSDLF